MISIKSLRLQIMALVLLVPPTVAACPVVASILLQQPESGFRETLRLLFLSDGAFGLQMLAAFTALGLILQFFYWQAACFLWRTNRRQYPLFISAAVTNVLLCGTLRAFIADAGIAAHMLILATIPAGAFIASFHLYLLKKYHNCVALE